MNNKGWGLGIMVICICAVCFCLLFAGILLRKFENKTHIKMISNDSYSQIYKINKK